MAKDRTRWMFAPGLPGLLLVAGCVGSLRDDLDASGVHRAIDAFVSDARDAAPRTLLSPADDQYLVLIGPSDHEIFRTIAKKAAAGDEFTLGMPIGLDDEHAASQPEPASAPAESSPTKSPYWRPSLVRQMGGELKEFGTRDLWR